MSKVIKKKTLENKDKYSKCPFSNEDLNILKLTLCDEGKRAITRLKKSTSFINFLNKNASHIVDYFESSSIDINGKYTDIFYEGPKEYYSQISDIQDRYYYYNHDHDDCPKFEFTGKEVDTIISFTKERIRLTKIILSSIKALEGKK